MSEFMTRDEFDKLETAAEYLSKAPVGSQEFDSAAEHLRWTLDNQPQYRPHVALVVQVAIKNRDNDAKVIRRLKDILV